jgi:putative phosphoesterase
MRIAVIADIHGNSAALDAVLADIAAQAPDLTVNLGDCLSGALDPAGTAARLMALGLPTVAGNHDRWLIDRPIAAMGLYERLTWPEIGQPERAWLATLPPRIEIEGVLFCHGTPAADDVFWLDLPRDGEMALAPADWIERHGAGVPNRLILCGHTHVPRLVRLADGRLVVNPGSVGNPAYADPRPPRPYGLSTGLPDARYALLTRRDGGWRAELRHVPYDARGMIALAEAKGMPDWAEALATGWIGGRESS